MGKANKICRHVHSVLTPRRQQDTFFNVWDQVTNIWDTFPSSCSGKNLADNDNHPDYLRMSAKASTNGFLNFPLTIFITEARQVQNTVLWHATTWVYIYRLENNSGTILHDQR